MKKLFFLFAFLIGFGISMYGQLPETVELTTANTLATELGDKVGKVTSLTVKGPLGAEDFNTMKEKMTMLQELDMAGVTALPNCGTGLVGIPDEIFQKKLTLRKVVFPKVMQIIGSYAFQGCNNLMEVDFSLASQLQYIENSAFQECSGLNLADLSKCTELLNIKNFAFSSCSNLQELNLGNCRKLGAIKGYAFYSCVSLQTVNLSNCSALNSIGADCFNNCRNLNTVELEGCINLTKIEDRAFGSFSNSNQLLNFDFPKLTALTSIGDEAFASCALSGDIVFASAIVQIGHSAFKGCNNITSFDFRKSTKLAVISGGTFASCSQLKKVDFTNCSSLNTLDTDAFDNCPALESIGINNGFYTSINGALFVVDKATLLLYPGGKKDVEYKIPPSVITIGEYAFPYNQSLTDLTIPKSVLTIKEQAFYQNSSSKLKVIMESATPIGLSASIGLNGMLVYVPKGSGAAYRKAAIWRDSKIIEIDADATTVTLSTAGSLGAKLMELKIAPNIITELIISGPMNASDFEVIKQMELLQKIDLSKVDLENDKLPNNAFTNDNSNWLIYLKEVSLPSSLKIIGSVAFSGLYALQKVEIPKSIEEIGVSAFSGCSSLEKVDLSALGNLKRIESNAFSSSSMINANLKLPNSLEYIGWRAFEGTSVTTVDFSKTSITEIGYSAFENCVITGALSFPATLNKIGNGAFASAKVTAITLKSIDMVRIGNADVFKSVDKTKCIVNVPKGLKNRYKADTYWSPFGDNIKEFGKLITVSSNNNGYGNVIGGGAYEKGEKVTLKAVCNENAWEEFGQKQVYLFSGWYDGDKNISEETIYTYTVGEEDKELTGKFIRIRFGIDNYTSSVIEKVKSDAKSITVKFESTSVESKIFAGWFDGETCLSKEKELTLTVGDDDKDRDIVVKIYGDQMIIESDQTITDINKADGVKVIHYRGGLSIEGAKDWKVKSFSYYWDNPLLVNSKVIADEISLNWDVRAGRWYFISFPYDLKVQDIKFSNLSQFVVREYDGNKRATSGVGESWKQISSTGTLKAYKGYILQSSSYDNSPDSFNASSGMESLFNKDAVTVQLSSYASSSTMDANWNFVGNPYPCYYKVSQLFEDGFDAPVTVWSPELNNYEYFTQDDADAYLSPLAAFFIQKNKKDVIFKPEGRVALLPADTQTRSALRSDDGRTVINLVLSNGSLSDRSRIVFNEAASLDYELGKDAAKFSGMDANVPMLFSLDKANNQLAINERPMGDGIVRLGCSIGVKGSYTLDLKEAVSVELSLVDLKTGAVCDLSKEAYTFDAEVGEFIDRFELRSGTVTSNLEIEQGFRCFIENGQLIVSGLPANTSLSVSNTLGQIVFNGMVSDERSEIVLSHPGIYYITLVTVNGQRIVRSIKR